MRCAVYSWRALPTALPLLPASCLFIVVVDYFLLLLSSSSLVRWQHDGDAAVGGAPSSAATATGETQTTVDDGVQTSSDSRVGRHRGFDPRLSVTVVVPSPYGRVISLYTACVCLFVKHKAIVDDKNDGRNTSCVITAIIGVIDTSVAGSPCSVSSAESGPWKTTGRRPPATRCPNRERSTRVLYLFCFVF